MRRRVTDASGGAGNVGEVGGRDHALAAAESSRTSSSRRSASSSLMTSSSSISGVRPRSLGEHRALGEQQREQRQALLALGAVDAQLAAVAQDRELVAVGAVAGEAALEVAGAGARAARRGTPPRRRRASAGGTRAPTSPLQPSSRGALGERLARAARRPRARCARSASALRGELAVPGSPASPREARPERIRPSSALRCASTREYSRRSPARSGQSAATTWSRWARRSAGGPLTAPAGRAGTRSPAACVSTSSRRSTGAPSAVIRLTGWALAGDACRSRRSARARRRRRAGAPTTRAACAPKRTSSRSLRVRGERPVQPK